MTQTDRGVALKKEQHEEVANVAQALQKYCVSEPVKCPLIFGGNILFKYEASLDVDM